MKIIRSSVPINSLLNIGKIEYDYLDCFSGFINDVDNTITSEDLARVFMSSAPGWVVVLFALRNKVVSAIGLKTSSG